MKANNLIATAQITIKAPIDKVWEAFVNPALIEKYMFGTHVQTDWKEGSPITWKGEWDGKPYEDKGEILQFKPKSRLQYSHFSPVSGRPDIPENYHIVTIDVAEENGHTTVRLSQDKNESEQVKEHSEKNWNRMLSELKKLVGSN
jgi:uncharacterized protein YndB with AHSA1/START domain